MAYKRRNYRKKTAGRRYRKKSKAAKSNSKVATRGYVKRILHKEVENKYYLTFATAQQVYIQCNTQPSTGAGLIDLIPPIGLGNTSSGRIGNKVKVMSSRIDMVINLNPYVAVTNPYVPAVFVKIWIFKLRTSNISTGPTLGEWQSWFNGNGTNIALQGSEADLVFEVNRDLFEVYKTKTLWLTNTGNSSQIPQATSQMFSTGRSSMKCSFNLTKHLNTLIYNDTVTNAVTNKNLWCFVQPIYSQYNVVTGNAFNPINISYAHHTHYEDA